MKLTVQDFGKVEKAEFDFKGLTVIIGDNDTGKSTIGKILATLFTVFPSIDVLVKRARRRFVFARDRGYRYHAVDFDCLYNKEQLTLDDVIRELERSRKDRFFEMDLLVHDSKTSPEDRANLVERAAYILERIKACKEISDKELSEREILKAFRKYFYGDFTTKRATVELVVNKKVVRAELTNSTCSYEMNIKLINHGWFIGSPIVLHAASDEYLDDTTDRMHMPLIDRLRERDEENSVNRALVDRKIRQVNDILGDLLQGDVRFNEDSESLQFSGVDFPDGIPVECLSMGLKSFALLRLMLNQGVLQDRDILVLDEPENHLHPRWQIIYAELIVLLRECFDLTVLLTTHSPYFLEAIQLFSRKYHCMEELSIYQPEIGGNQKTVFRDVTDDPERLYKGFSSQLRELDKIRASIPE